MASETLSHPGVVGSKSGQQAIRDLEGAGWRILTLLGSLRITVVGFFLAIVILFVGTLAQDEETIVDVKREYFNSWVATVPLDVLFPVTIFPLQDRADSWYAFLFNENQRVGWTIILPGGALIGLVLLINLIAAKLTRFHMTATGGRLVAGLAFCLVGATITAVVILGAHAEDGLQGEPPSYLGYERLWQICRGTIWLSTLGSFAALVFYPFKSLLGRWAVIVLAASLGVWSLGIALYPETLRIPDPGLRIVWQMGKSVIAGGILLTGLILLFGRRGGNVLIHLSIGLLMLGQFIFGDRQIEERITLADGEKTSMAMRVDECELAVIDSSSPGIDKVVAIDEDALLRSFRSQQPFVDPALPFQVFVKQFYQNAGLADAKKSPEGEKNLATKGHGMEMIAVPREKSGGAKEATNMPAAYVEIKSRDGKDSLGTYLVAVQMNDLEALSPQAPADFKERIELDGKTYSMALRFRRSYKDYVVKLNDVRRIDYSGSNTPRDYSSFVTFTDREGGDSLEGRIWMNNPMRYRGETFYQSSFDSSTGRDITSLQVVRNAGWLMPYIACAFAALGMLAHFGTTFTRFALRFDRERRASQSTPPSPKSSHQEKEERKQAPGVPAEVAKAMPSDLWREASMARRGLAGWLVPLATVVVVGGLFAYAARIPTAKPGDFDWYAAGTLPVLHEGRVKPVDSVARNILLALSGRTTALVRAPEGSNEKDRKYSATEWFYGMISDADWVEDAKIFRIDAKEVLDTLELDPEQSGGTIGLREKIFGPVARHRYSLNQIGPKLEAFDQRMKTIGERQKKNPESLKFVDQKFIELYQKLSIFQFLRQAYSTDRLPRPPEKSDDEGAQRQFMQQLLAEMEEVKRLEATLPPAMLPPMSKPQGKESEAGEEGTWRALRPALFTAFAERIMQMQLGADHPALMPLLDVVSKVHQEKGQAFNAAVETYRKEISKSPVAKPKMDIVAFEAWYNKFNAVTLSSVFYLVAGILCFLSFLVMPQTLRRTAFWIVVVVAIAHFLAIASRIYIQGRAPVTNLYSSAVFIGFGSVIIGLIVELLFPLRIGLLVGALSGYASLLVAYGLEDGDTMPVLQAVLDTQFWLTTHVICISLGYLATFMAGFIAIGAIVHRMLHREQLAASRGDAQAAEVQRILYRVSYGIICFATFFSLIGTVLGGLWADDSWGRFWGWDPKENGALMIVLWNAIVLHARWDKLVRERGFALLAIGGNIITAWSWFGTNQLGVGLHSYGFTSGVLLTLLCFVLSQVAIIIIGWALTRSSPPSTGEGGLAGSWE